MSFAPKDSYDGDFITYATDEVVCPFCGYIHTDSFELADYDDDFECQNEECGKHFVVERVVEVTYNSSRKLSDVEPEQKEETSNG